MKPPFLLVLLLPAALGSIDQDPGRALRDLGPDKKVAVCSVQIFGASAGKAVRQAIGGTGAQ